MVIREINYNDDLLLRALREGFITRLCFVGDVFAKFVMMMSQVNTVRVLDVSAMRLTSLPLTSSSDSSQVAPLLLLSHVEEFVFSLSFPITQWLPLMTSLTSLRGPLRYEQDIRKYLMTTECQIKRLELFMWKSAEDIVRLFEKLPLEYVTVDGRSMPMNIWNRIFQVHGVCHRLKSIHLNPEYTEFVTSVLQFIPREKIELKNLESLTVSLFFPDLLSIKANNLKQLSVSSNFSDDDVPIDGLCFDNIQSLTLKRMTRRVALSLIDKCKKNLRKLELESIGTYAEHELITDRIELNQLRELSIVSSDVRIISYLQLNASKLKKLRLSVVEPISTDNMQSMREVLSSLTHMNSLRIQGDYFSCLSNDVTSLVEVSVENYLTRLQEWDARIFQILSKNSELESYESEKDSVHTSLPSDWLAQLLNSCQSMVNLKIPRIILNSLPDLTQLQVCYNMQRMSIHASNFSLEMRNRFPNMRELEIREIDTESFHNLYLVVSSMEHIEYLKVVLRASHTAMPQQIPYMALVQKHKRFIVEIRDSITLEKLILLHMVLPEYCTIVQSDLSIFDAESYYRDDEEECKIEVTRAISSILTSLSDIVTGLSPDQLEEVSHRILSNQTLHSQVLEQILESVDGLSIY